MARLDESSASDSDCRDDLRFMVIEMKVIK